MMQPKDAFQKVSQEVVSKTINSQAVVDFYDNLTSRREIGISSFSNLELAKQRAEYIKWKVTENLDKYLLEFEASVIRKGGKVVWAYDSNNAIQEIESIIERTKSKKIVTGKSEIGEELGLFAYLKAKGFANTNTDLGLFLLNLIQEKPKHIEYSTLGFQRNEMTKVLNQSIKTSMEADDEEVVSDIRAELRSAFFEADLGITSANFLVADSGQVVISENEGNERLNFTFAKNQIVLASIDKILPTINDLELFLTLYASHSTGQTLKTYNTIVGPTSKDDFEGPSNFIVVMVDNGRSSLLETQEQRKALSCIKCSACSNVCPVFKILGDNNSYQSFIGGPIGQVYAPLQQGMNQFQFLSQASTYCGKCKSVCPVNIDIPNLLLRNRNENVLKGSENTGEKLSWFTWKKFMLNRKNLNKSVALKNFTLRQFYKTDWGENREFPKIPEKSFNQIWLEKNV